MTFLKINFILSAFFFLFLSTPLLHAYEFSADDRAFLEKVQKKALDYFLKEADSVTGLVRDRAPNLNAQDLPAVPGAVQEGETNTSPASIAASGYALSAYAVAAERGWMTKNEAMHRTRKALRFAANQVQHEHGFFYHFISTNSGKRVVQSEVSPIDSAIFVAGALFAAEYFKDPEISKLTYEIYERMDFPWMQNGGTFFALSWSPEKKFSEKSWDHFDESLLLYVLAMGSPSHPIDAKAWFALRRPVGSYQSHRMIAMPPLFTHQYPHIWLDFRNKQDGIMNYFNHSVTACEVSRVFSIDQSDVYKTYGPSAWGLTASDGPKGYKAYGAPPGWAIHDGTLAPTGCGGCMPFTPQESLMCMRHFYNQFGAQMLGRYGLSDAINEDEKWVSKQVLAIDQGTLLLMIENALSGLLWNTTNKIPAIQTAFQKIGFKPGTKELGWSEPPRARAPYVPGGIQVDGFMKDWPGGVGPVMIDKDFAEFGEFKKPNDAQVKIRFAWDEKALYFFAEVADDSLVARQNGPQLWRDDLLEIFVDPDKDGLFWEDERDYQIGFRPVPGGDGAMVWSWFQKGEDPTQRGWVDSRSFSDARGYMIEGSIEWNELGIFPKAGEDISLTFALHDVDQDKTHRKLQWFFRSEGGYKRFELGRLNLEAPRGKK